MRVYYLFGCGPAALGENRVIVADSAGNEGGPRGGLKAGWARFPRSWRGPPTNSRLSGSWRPHPCVQNGLECRRAGHSKKGPSGSGTPR
jgi:hypothetical protein